MRKKGREINKRKRLNVSNFIAEQSVHVSKEKRLQTHWLWCSLEDLVMKEGLPPYLEYH